MPYNALDRLWEHLDELTDRLLDAPDPDDRTAAAEVAWCISQFYGADMGFVRGEAMRRRASRERDTEPA
jgi:hypothetical protein